MSSTEDSKILEETIKNLEDKIAKMRQVLEANRNDFKMINESGMWSGHPFFQAILDIDDVLK